MRISNTLAAVSVVAGVASAHPTARQQAPCGPFKGNFTVKQYQLYPENADFDFLSCKLFIGYVNHLCPKYQ